MPPVSWLEIRKWNGSQSDAFEELCCQFAHSEATPEGSKYVSKGRPDSGIECYWMRINGRRGDFVDSKGQIITFDPSTREAGHSTLVIQREALLEFLEREKLALIWTLLSEKNIYPPEIHGPNWLGRLTILGIYSWQGQRINGGFRKEFFKGRS